MEVASGTQSATVCGRLSEDYHIQVIIILLDKYMEQYL